MKLAIGILCILGGILTLYSTIKTRKVHFSEGNYEPKWSGYLIGIGLVGLGIFFIVHWFNNDTN